jgi:hypothetical protein
VQGLHYRHKGEWLGASKTTRFTTYAAAFFKISSTRLFPLPRLEGSCTSIPLNKDVISIRSPFNKQPLPLTISHHPRRSFEVRHRYLHLELPHRSRFLCWIYVKTKDIRRVLLPFHCPYVFAVFDGALDRLVGMIGGARGGESTTAGVVVALEPPAAEEASGEVAVAPPSLLVS